LFGRWLVRQALAGSLVGESSAQRFYSKTTLSSQGNSIPLHACKRITSMAGNRKTFKHLTSHLLDDQGQDLVEYALIVALLAFATVAGSGTVSSSIQSAINGLATAVSNNT